MIRFLADEDFNGRIVRGLRLRNSEMDLVRVQDVGLHAAPDEDVLQWAADDDRILLTHDRRTVPACVFRRLARGDGTPGVIVVSDQASIGACIDELQLIWACSDAEDLRDQLYYLPLR